MQLFLFFAAYNKNKPADRLFLSRALNLIIKYTLWTWSHTAQHSCIYWAESCPCLVMPLLLPAVQWCQLVSVISCSASHVPSPISIVWPNSLIVEMQLSSSSWDLIRNPFSPLHRHTITCDVCVCVCVCVSSAHQQRDGLGYICTRRDKDGRHSH